MSQATDTKECVLKCKEATRFFDFPTVDIFRNIWLYKLGMVQCGQTAWVCDRHFSKNMFSSSGLDLVDLAVPDENLPESSINKNDIYEQLIKKLNLETPEKEELKKSILPVTTNTSELMKSLPLIISVTTIPALKNPKTNIPSKSLPAVNTTTATTPGINVTMTNFPSTKGVMKNRPDLLGKQVCDVIELPQYIVVRTSCSATGLIKPTPRSNSVQTKSKENIRPPLYIHSSKQRKITKNLTSSIETITIDDDDDVIASPEIDYVYYVDGEAVPKREREVQVDIPISTKETAIQCNIELENDLAQMTQKPLLLRVEQSLFNAPINLQECLDCGEILPTTASKLMHEEEHKRISSLCPHCGIIFPNHFKLKLHEKDAHSEHEMLEIKKALRCPRLHCKKAFHSRRQLYNHIDEHYRYVEYKCKKCQRVFASALRLYCHQNAFKNCFTSKWLRTRRRIKRK